MQLKKRQLRRSLGLVTANLFMATHGYAEQVVTEDSAPPPNTTTTPINQAVENLGTTELDSSMLIYNEQGGRVRAIEPVFRLAVTGNTGNVFTAKFTYDSLTGATPNGATPWKQTQTFMTPAPNPGSTMAATGASGGRTIVNVPGTGTHVAEYQTPAHQLPVDHGFRDHRYAFNLGYSEKWNSNTNISMGFAYSKELDYRSMSINGAFARDFNDHNTTLRLGLNYEYDKSSPIFGTPTPLDRMNGFWKGPPESKDVVSLIAGLTQVMDRYWLLQLNYEVGSNQGYQTDPYRIISVINPVTGGPEEYRYESRPQSRLRQSIYLANKVAIGPTAADISFRYYRDSWGIRSLTANISERIPLSSRMYIEPEFYYYHQSAANFFTYYLLGGQPLPQYASADGRLAKFRARTVGIRFGYSLSPKTDLYVMAEDYKQMGAHYLPNAPGDLAHEDVFSGVHARSIIAGFTYKFSLSSEGD